MIEVINFVRTSLVYYITSIYNFEIIYKNTHKIKVGDLIGVMLVVGVLVGFVFKFSGIGGKKDE